MATLHPGEVLRARSAQTSAAAATLSSRLIPRIGWPGTGSAWQGLMMRSSTSSAPERRGPRDGASRSTPAARSRAQGCAQVPAMAPGTRPLRLPGVCRTVRCSPAGKLPEPEGGLPAGARAPGGIPGVGSAGRPALVWAPAGTWGRAPRAHGHTLGPECQCAGPTLPGGAVSGPRRRVGAVLPAGTRPPRPRPQRAAPGLPGSLVAVAVSGAPGLGTCSGPEVSLLNLRSCSWAPAGQISLKPTVDVHHLQHEGPLASAAGSSFGCGASPLPVLLLLQGSEE